MDSRDSVVCNRCCSLEIMVFCTRRRIISSKYDGASEWKILYVNQQMCTNSLSVSYRNQNRYGVERRNHFQLRLLFMCNSARDISRTAYSNDFTTG